MLEGTDLCLGVSLHIMLPRERSRALQLDNQSLGSGVYETFWYLSSKGRERRLSGTHSSAAVRGESGARVRRRGRVTAQMDGSDSARALVSVQAAHYASSSRRSASRAQAWLAHARNCHLRPEPRREQAAVTVLACESKVYAAATTHVPETSLPTDTGRLRARSSSSLIASIQL